MPWILFIFLVDGWTCKQEYKCWQIESLKTKFLLPVKMATSGNTCWTGSQRAWKQLLGHPELQRTSGRDGSIQHGSQSSSSSTQSLGMSHMRKNNGMFFSTPTTFLILKRNSDPLLEPRLKLQPDAWLTWMASSATTSARSLLVDMSFVYYLSYLRYHKGSSS